MDERLPLWSCPWTRGVRSTPWYRARTVCIQSAVSGEIDGNKPVVSKRRRKSVLDLERRADVVLLIAIIDPFSPLPRLHIQANNPKAFADRPFLLGDLTFMSLSIKCPRSSIPLQVSARIRVSWSSRREPLLKSLISLFTQNHLGIPSHWTAEESSSGEWA